MFKNIDMKDPLDILLATYGDPLDCCENIEGTEICQQKVLEFWKRDRIGFRASSKLDEIFGNDPHPDAPKAHIDFIDAATISTCVTNPNFDHALVINYALRIGVEEVISFKYLLRLYQSRFRS